MPVQLRVVEPTGNSVIIDLCDTDEQMKDLTVKQLKKKIIPLLKIDTAVVDIRMVYRTEQLDESSRLVSYGIQHLSTIHTMMLLPGGL